MWKGFWDRTFRLASHDNLARQDVTLFWKCIENWLLACWRAALFHDDTEDGLSKNGC